MYRQEIYQATSPATSQTSGYSPPAQSSGHRHTGSSSSQGSRSSRRDHYTTGPTVESVVTRLLVAIKQLLEALTQWSNGRMTEAGVSDVYVQLGNDFNAAVAAFSQYNIDMSELMSVPDDLRAILETCLAEDASPAVLEMYLPDVRTVITSLLEGLRSKQGIYRRIVERNKHSSSDSSRQARSSRSIQDRTKSSRDPRYSSSSRRHEVTSGGELASTNAEDGRFAGAVPEDSAGVSASIRGLSSNTGIERTNSSMNGSSPYFPPAQEVVPPPREQGESLAQAGGRSPSTPVMSAPPNVVRYSLSDPPVPKTPQTETSTPAVIVDSTETSQNDALISDPSIEDRSALPAPVNAETETETETRRGPAAEHSLAALKKSDALERRASKRFSTYTFTKITGSRDKGNIAALDKLISGDDRLRRRSKAIGISLTPGELDSLVEENEEPLTAEPARERSSSSRRQARAEFDVPPMPPLPESLTPSRTPEPPTDGQGDKSQDTTAHVAESAAARSEPSYTTVTVFLRLGLQVKKVILERDSLSIPSLRLQFTERFSYNPGMENFPAIYINDPDSHIQYELEDMDEIKEKSLLSLNIEPLDQIKQHIDLHISNLAQDIKELKSTVGSARRQSIPVQPPSAQAPIARPSDSQFAMMAKRVARLSRMPIENGPTRQMSFPDGRSQSPQPPAQLMPQMTGGSDVASTRIVNDLKTQFDEVQNLRRDLGVMRQLYTDFMAQTKESLGTLRTQTASVRQLAAVKVGGARAYIDSGKANLDSRSQNVLTKVEDLQDTIETLKHDVLKRHISPKPALMLSLKADIEATAKELQSLPQQIQTVKPMWKKTWEEELQNIVEEQQFLSYQEEFVTDLLEDHKALCEVYGHIEKVISLRGTGSGRSRGAFRPPPMDEGHNGLSTVMMEIRSAAVDPERRLKAIAANKKNREKELASQSDEFQAELNGFVQGKKLKMTGGAEEVERMRQKRNEISLKQMFNPGVMSTAGETPGNVEGYM